MSKSKDGWTEGPWFVSSRERWGDPDFCVVLCKATDPNGDEITVLIAEHLTRETAERIVSAVNALDAGVVGKVREALKEMQIDYCDQMCPDRPVHHMHECEKASAALALLRESE